MDEIAALVKQDLVEYRLRHLSDTRLIEVVKAAAKTADWQARPSARPEIQRKGVAAGRGMACVLYEGDNGYCAMVAEVEVNQDAGTMGGGLSSLTTAGRYRIPTACATSSRGERCPGSAGRCSKK